MEPLPERILYALERLSRAFQVLQNRLGQEHRLSALQIQVLLHLSALPSETARLVDLARYAGVHKPTMSVALKGLREKGFLEVLPSEDRRAQPLRLTERARQALQPVRQVFRELQEVLHAFPASQQTAAYEVLLRMIAQLERRGFVQDTRMCLQCRFFVPDSRGGYCQFLERPLARHELRIRCPDFQPA